MTMHETPRTCPICDHASIQLTLVSRDAEQRTNLRFACRSCGDDALVFVIANGSDYWALNDEQSARRDALEDGAPVTGIVWGDRLIGPQHPLYPAVLSALRASPDGVIRPPSYVVRPMEDRG